MEGERFRRRAEATLALLLAGVTIQPVRSLGMLPGVLGSLLLVAVSQNKFDSYCLRIGLGRFFALGLRYRKMEDGEVRERLTSQLLH